MNELSVSGNIVDIVNKKIFPGTIFVRNGKIHSIRHDHEAMEDRYIMPGFIDAHVHIESSMMIPSEFARLAVVHGTVATVSDPHEIANVMGIEGIRYMLKNGQKVNFHFYFGAPSCVPATTFETAGASISAEDIRTLFVEDGLKYLSEVMNYPGVLSRDAAVMKKIHIAQELGCPIDGHAPGLRGENAKRYITAGISTDHECFTLEEALDKVNEGMHILIREGSAAKNFEALHPLIKSHPQMVMFCSDDKHPNELEEGHINELVHRAIVEKGYDTMDVLRCACLNPVMHYNLDVGVLQKGDPADFIIVDNLRNFNVESTYIKGLLVAEQGRSLIPSVKASVINHFDINEKSPKDFSIAPHGLHIRVIEALEGELITHLLEAPEKIVNNNIVSNPELDILKLAVINRYNNAPPAIGFIRNFGLKKGAIASCIAHDSHNIIAVGVSDEDICLAVNALIRAKGGICAVSGKAVDVLPLPVAGIMSNGDGYDIAKRYAAIDKKAKQLGTQLHAPFMTLSFMALLVIPSLKLSDKGLFDGEAFKFTSLSY